MHHRLDGNGDAFRTQGKTWKNPGLKERGPVGAQIHGGSHRVRRANPQLPARDFFSIGDGGVSL
jgi:hypothetical protein